MRTMAQAIRNAIEIERAAGRFYLQLLGMTKDPATRGFLQEMAAQEEDHAKRLEALAAKIEAGELPASPDDQVHGVETAPGWTCSDEVMLDLRNALTIAIEAENSAALYYDAMADSAEGEVKKFFLDLVDTENGHARMLTAKLSELND